MADLPKTIKINELPEATSIKDTDIFIIEDGSVTHKITGKNLLSYIKNHGDISDYYVHTSSIGASNGVAPLNSNKKVPSANLTFGTTSGTIYDGAKGKALEDSWDAHLLDTDAHMSTSEKNNITSHISNTNVHVTSTEKSNFHTHTNKSVLDLITQEKINQWDSNTGSGGEGEVTSLTDLGVTATASELNVLDGITATTVELNYVDGVTSNIQTQLNTLSTSVSGLSTTVSGKADASHGTHVTYSTTTPLSDGTGSVGTATTVARSDHRHPSDSTKADTNHTQSASTITGGVLGGQVSTPEGTDYDTNRVRNIVLVNEDPTSGTDSTYVNGTIICVYE